jgi:probable rRNA maturation factor
MPPIEVQISVMDGLDIPLAAERLEEAVRTVLRAEQVDEAEISLALVDDSEIARVNREYLQHDYVTDVISFPLQLEDTPPLGDVYIGVEQARRQAGEMGIGLDEEILRLAIHGTLHVLGYDHPEGEERMESPMFARQEELLREFLGGASTDR